MAAGSPPRAWGKLMADIISLVTLRFTPTCVGKTNFHLLGDPMMIGSPPRAWGKPRSELLLPPRMAVHPHVRGENAVHGLPVIDLAVHPHVRGENTRHRLWGTSRGRFTPTCVGKTPADPPETPPCHGSPPRAWGKLKWLREARLIGKVHPHVRGENLF